MRPIKEDKGRVRPVVEDDFQCDENGNSTRIYEVLSIVGYAKADGTKLGYISKTNVPIGIPITDTKYWYPFQVIGVPKGDKGDKGDRGDDGKSAYDLYIEHGGTITPVEAWIASLQGKDGRNGRDGRDGVDGRNGRDGKDGKDGKDGRPLQLRISSDGQSIEISSDGGETWYVFEKNFSKLRVLGYIDSISDLPRNANIGDIYGVRIPDEEVEEDEEYTYNLYINTVTGWNLDYTITKVYDYDTELPSSAADGTTVLVPVDYLTLDKEKIDGYKVYRFSLEKNGWVLILDTAEIYASKEDIINHGDNVYALVQGDEEHTYKLYKRVVGWVYFGTNGSITYVLVQDIDEATETNILSGKAVTDAYGRYIESPEFVRAYLDGEDKILWGIKTDGTVYFGAGVPPQVKDYIEERIGNYDDVITFLDDLEEGDETLRELLNKKVDKEEGKSLIDEEYAEGVHYIESPEFAEVKLDQDERILEAIMLDGTKLLPAGYEIGSNVVKTISNPEYLAAWLDSADHILFALNADGDVIFGCGIPSQIKEHIDELIKPFEELFHYEDNPEFIDVKLDSENKVLEGIKNDGTKVVGGNLEILGSLDINGITYSVVSNPEWLKAVIDAENKVICGIKTDGTFCVVDIDFLDSSNKIKEVLNHLDAKNNPEFLSVELDEKEKILGGRKIDGTKFENVGLDLGGAVLKGTDDLESRMEVKIDSEEKIISYRKEDGTLIENVGIETNHLELTKQGMNDFQQALKDAGFTPGGGGDYSDTITEKGKKPVYIPTPRLARVNIIWDGNLSNLSKADRGGTQKVNYDVKVPVEFFDGQGVYFKKYALMSAQGNSSMAFVKKNISLKFFDTEDVEGSKHKWGKGDTFGTVFGDWVMQKTYHLKAFYTDFIRGSSQIAYQLADEVYKTRGVYDDRPWKKALINFNKITSVTPAGLSKDGSKDMNLQIDNGARCMPDGFPVIVYQNGEFYGIYVWMLKKDADNFNMDTSNVKHIHLDGTLYVNYFWGGNIDWTMFEIRNPEDLVCMDGSDYDGDFPAELIDSTSEHYDSSDENHVRSAQVKQYIIDLSHRVGEINALTPTYTRPDETVITLNDCKGIYNSGTSYARGNYVLDQENVTHYYMSLHNENVGRALSDTEYWHDITDDIATIKEVFETYFDVDNLVDYQLINMACGDIDGFGKNWQWTTWDGVKWYVNQYDKDMAFGNMFTGMFTLAPRTGWISSGHYLPCGLSVVYYKLEHKTRWIELTNAGIFSANHIKEMVTAWISRIGKDNFVQEWKKWPESPCNRNSKINFEYWKFTGGNTTETPSSNIWDNITSYNVGDRVWFKAFDGNWYLQFEAVKAGDNHPCLTGSYSVYPMSMGYRDSAWRFYKYIEETISNQNSFINSL